MLSDSLISKLCNQKPKPTAMYNMFAGVTAIEPSALSEVAKPLCTWSGPLLEPAPAYSPASDAVQCWQHVTFGKHAWPLPPVLTRHEDSDVCTAVFATAVLEGKALTVFQGTQHCMLSGTDPQRFDAILQLDWRVCIILLCLFFLHAVILHYILSSRLCCADHASADHMVGSISSKFDILLHVVVTVLLQI